MQFQIHSIGERRVSLPVCELPGAFEGVVPLPPALGAWPVPGCKRYCLIKKEQLGIAIRGHYHAVPPAEPKDTGNPASVLEGAHNLPVGVVQSTAPVAHHRAASRCTKDVAKRVYAVLEGHLQIT
jgi:hypothetical protein